MKSHLKELFEYNFEMNEQLIKRAMEIEDLVSDKSKKLISHIFNAQEIWNARILGRNSAFGVWQIHEMSAWKPINQQMHDASLAILHSNTLDVSVEYSNTKGDHFSNTIQDILFHIINHSTYHRGQIASDFRNSGIEPIVSDFIFYKR